MSVLVAVRMNGEIQIKGLIRGILIPYLEQLTGEKWILLKDKEWFFEIDLDFTVKAIDL